MHGNKIYSLSLSLLLSSTGTKISKVLMCAVSRADSRFVPSQWEMSLQSNIVSHWLGAILESALCIYMEMEPYTYIYIFVVLFWWSGTGKWFRIKKETSCLPLVRPGFEAEWCLRHQIANRLNACSKTDWATEHQVKNLNSIIDIYTYIYTGLALNSLRPSDAYIRL